MPLWQAYTIITHSELRTCYSEMRSQQVVATGARIWVLVLLMLNPMLSLVTTLTMGCPGTWKHPAVARRLAHLQANRACLLPATFPWKFWEQEPKSKQYFYIKKIYYEGECKIHTRIFQHKTQSFKEISYWQLAALGDTLSPPEVHPSAVRVPSIKQLEAILTYTGAEELGLWRPTSFDFEFLFPLASHETLRCFLFSFL